MNFKGLDDFPEKLYQLNSCHSLSLIVHFINSTEKIHLDLAYLNKVLISDNQYLDITIFLIQKIVNGSLFFTLISERRD